MSFLSYHASPLIYICAQGACFKAHGSCEGENASAGAQLGSCKDHMRTPKGHSSAVLHCLRSQICRKLASGSGDRPQVGGGTKCGLSPTLWQASLPRQRQCAGYTRAAAGYARVCSSPGIPCSSAPYIPDWIYLAHLGSRPGTLCCLLQLYRIRCCGGSETLEACQIRYFVTALYGQTPGGDRHPAGTFSCVKAKVWPTTSSTLLPSCNRAAWIKRCTHCIS